VYNPRKEWENADIFVFKNGAPFQMQVPDGRAIYSGGTWIYEFDYKDHLGNTRVSFRAVISKDRRLRILTLGG
jgi:hypothetical protein